MADVEIDQKTYSAVAQLKVGQNLRFICFSQLPDRLGLDDDGLFDQQVQAKTRTQIKAIVVNRNWLFGNDIQSTFSQFVFESSAIDALKASRVPEWCARASPRLPLPR